MTEGTYISLLTHNVPPSLTITLVVSASMIIFRNNTLANFKISWVKKKISKKNEEKQLRKLPFLLR